MSQRSVSPAQSSNRISESMRWWALAAVLITMFFSSMDQTVVSTAMPSIIGQLKGLSLYSWVFTAYMMASAVTVPIYGKLSDSYGRKPFYVFGLVVFMVGSAISGQAHSMMDLIAARALQGIGAGAMLSMPRATIGDIFNPRERGRWMGIIGAVFGLASIVGPTLGGWITDTYGWRWVFYINLPIAAVALVLVLVSLPTVRASRGVRADWTGISLLIVGLLPILLAFTWAGSQYAWGSWQVLSLFGLGVVALAAFVLVELRSPDAVLSPALFSNRTFTSSVVVQLLVSMGLFGALMYLPLYVQGVIGLSAAASGAIMTPMMLAFIGSSVVAGQIMTKTGRYKVMAHVSALVMAAGMFLLMSMTASTSYTTAMLNVVVMGLGVGALMPILNVAVQNAFPYEVMGTVNATQQFASSLGGVIAAPILGTLMTRTFAARLPGLMPPRLTAFLAHLPPAVRRVVTNPTSLTNAAAQAALGREFRALGPLGSQMYGSFLHAVRVALADGMHQLFLAGFVFAGAALLGTLALKEVPLRTNEYFTEPTAPAEEPAGGPRRLVVTLSAAYGAGGSAVGRRLADALGLPFLDRLITEEALLSDGARQLPMADSPAGARWARLAHQLTLAGVNVPLAPDGTWEEEQFRADTEAAMRGSAAERGAVVVGRAAALVFARDPAAFHVRLTAPWEDRYARVAKRRTVSAEQFRAVDRAREEYVRHFYHVDPTQPAGYDLVVDTGGIGDREVVDRILAALPAAASAVPRTAGPSPRPVPDPS